MMNKNINQLFLFLLEKYGDEKVKKDEPMIHHTSFKIGGKADIYFQANDKSELIFALNASKNFNVPIFILGGGTNILVSDSGIEGLVIKNNLNKVIIKKYSGVFSQKNIKKLKVLIEAESGLPVNQLVRFTLNEKLSGLEAFLGQPGSVGGAVYMNAHNLKLGEFFGEKIKTAKILTLNGKIKEVGKEYFKFSYDQSILHKSKEIVLSINLELTKGDNKQIWSKANFALEHRRRTQPLGFASSGCIFKNISKAQALRIGTPLLTTSAGYLIEMVGLKNFQIGGAKFSDKHANFIINTGCASFADVYGLINLAKKKVRERFGVELEEEVIIIGREN